MLLACGIAYSVKATALPWKVIPEEGVWKGASLADVSAVLDSVVSVLQPHFPHQEATSIRVTNAQGGPIVYFRRAEDGSHRVKLDTGGTYWSQYAFQFAHECGHILCGYKEGHDGNKWFEESLCEMFSLFALRSMARAWKENPPYTNWRDYGAKLHGYAQERIDENRLPEGTVLSAWINDHLPALEANPTDRPKNTAIAIELLAFFEEKPSRLGALSYLNTGWDGKKESFPESLTRWKKESPVEHHATVDYLRSMLLP